jgi:hypothetical protein
MLTTSRCGDNVQINRSKLPSTEEEWAVEFAKYKNFPE